MRFWHKLSQNAILFIVNDINDKNNFAISRMAYLFYIGTNFSDLHFTVSNAY